MNTEQVQDQNSANGRTTAVSVFEQSNGMNDFPVLKAFQEYIEAEQTRARKRMLGLSIFFVVLLVVVVVTFSAIMAAVINRDQQSLSAIATRNQELSDKLLDIALRERGHQPSANAGQSAVPVVVPTTSAAENAAVLQPVLDRLEKLATSLNKPQPQIPMVAPMTQPVVVPAQVQQPIIDPPLGVAQRQQEEELRRQREAISAERAKLKAEQELLRREQVEQHRRRLYPEYYAQEDARRNAEEAAKRALNTLPPPSTRPVGQSPITVPAVAPVVKSEAEKLPTKPVIDRKSIIEAKPVDLNTTKPISYFEQDDDGPLDPPVKKGEAVVHSPSRASAALQAKKEEKKAPNPVHQQKTETIAVGTQGNDQIPWLIEIPETK